MRETIKTALISIGLIFISYIILCLCISFKVNKILNASFEFYGEANTFQDDISDSLFRSMCYRNREHREYNDIYEENWHSFPITIVWLNNAKSWYWYDYSSAFCKSKTDLLPMTLNLKLKNFRWVITNVKFNS